MMSKVITDAVRVVACILSDNALIFGTLEDGILEIDSQHLSIVSAIQ